MLTAEGFGFCAGNASGLASELSENWDDMEPSERRKLVELIAQESTDASQIVEDLLVSARADLGQLPLLRQPIDLILHTLFAIFLRRGEAGNKLKRNAQCSCPGF